MKKTKPGSVTKEQIKIDEKLLKEYIPSKKEIEKQQKKLQKRVLKIKRNHKLYVRDSNNSLRRLDKISEDIYGRIIILFLKGTGEKRYAELNKGVKSWKDLKPIQMPLDDVDREQFNKLRSVLKINSKSIIVSYNGSWKPLVHIYMFEPKIKLIQKEDVELEKQQLESNL